MRRAEWLILAYFSYAALLAALLPVRPDIARTTILLNALVIAGVLLLRWAESLRHRELVSIVRDWYAFPTMLLAYREMGWFAQPHQDFSLERSWVVYDRFLLNELGLRALIECCGPVFPALLELSYTLVYAIAGFSVAMLYAYHKRQRTDEFLSVFLMAIFFSYALFPYFPSEPPRTVFPGEDFPSVETLFRRFNWFLLGGYGIHTSVFPSAHVSGSFAAAFAMLRVLPRPRWIGILLFTLATLIAIATIYGRYHYAVDAVAGFAISVGAAWLGKRWASWSACPIYRKQSMRKK